MRIARSWLIPASMLGVGFLGTRVLRSLHHNVELNGAVAVVTGGSRGLGLALARELAERGCRVAICARDPAELERARADLVSRGAEVLAIQCDVADRSQVQQLARTVTDRFGRIDVLINNAGVIGVGPLEHQRLDDFEQTMKIMFWGAVYPTLEVLPSMRARGSGSIVNITSVGGKISVPHLVPYSASKFAAIGFSEGLHAELAREGIHVMTVVPGLMRTGSHYNAIFKGQHRQEFLWFSLGATLPFTSMDADAAARRIVRGIQHQEAELILSWQANVAVRVQGLMPGITSEVLGLVNRLLPAPGGIGSAERTGYESTSALTESPIERMGQQAARGLNQ